MEGGIDRHHVRDIREPFKKCLRGIDHRRNVQRRQGGHPPEVVEYSIVEPGGSGDPWTAVDDPVAHGIYRAEVSEEPLEDGGRLWGSRHRLGGILSLSTPVGDDNEAQAV